MVKRRLLTLLSVISVAATVAATLMVFAQDRVFDADDFASTLGSTLREPEVNDYLADEVSAALVDQIPNLAVSGPLLADVTGAVLESDTAIGIVEAAAREAHRVVFDGGEDTLVLELSDLVVSVQLALEAINPELAEGIPDDIESLTVDLSAGELTAGTVRLAEQMRMITAVLVVAAILLMLAVIALESSVFRGLARFGFVLGTSGLVLIVSVAAGAAVFASYGRTELERDALGAAWFAVLGDLDSWGWVLVVLGGLLASLGWAVANVGNVAGRARDAVAFVTAEPSTARGDVARAVALLALAAWALLSPVSLLATLLRVAGFGLAVFVIAELLDRFGLAERLDRVQERARTDEDPIALRSVLTRGAIGVTVLTALGVVAVVLLANDDDASALVDPDACNGHVELCDRRLDDVTFATAHNSMGSVANEFYLPNHLVPMRAMLDDGVRGFMIDTYYGRETADGGVLTSGGLLDVDTLDDDARRVAQQIADRQTGDLGQERVYLCHGYCEIGALDAVDELTVLRAWLEENPREVVVVIVQDATEPADTAQVFDEAGFGDLVHTQARGEPMPSLRDMIDSGRRVFVMVEENGDGVDWLHSAFEFSQETPFSFRSADDFTCESNRGVEDAPLFVVNHFITPALPSNQDANDFDLLLERVERCRDERGLHPNLVAVDFVGQGDVMAVVDRLNGVG